jgi:hypothetical protein
MPWSGTADERRSGAALLLEGAGNAGKAGERPTGWGVAVVAELDRVTRMEPGMGSKRAGRASWTSWSVHGESM